MGMGADAVVTRLSVVVDMDTDKASGKAGKFGKGLSKLTGPAVAAGAAVAGIALKAGQSASRLQQSMGAVESVFGSSAGQIKKWSETAASSVGLAQSEYAELASTLGAQLKNMGVPMDQIAGKTNELITMGADLSATYGGTTADAVAALGSTLRGETDPIERYGVSIKQATIEAAVGKDKLKGMTDAQKSAAKTTATLGLITKQAGGAVGAFGREADTASGQQQRATAAWEDASAALGTSLLPIMTAVAQQLAKVAGWVKDNQTTVKVLAGVILVLAAAVVTLNVAMSIYNTIAAVTAAVSGAAWAATLGPILLVVGAVLAVVGIVVLLYKKVGWFRRFVDATWRKIAAGAKAAWALIRVAVSTVINILRVYLTAYLTVFKLVFRAAVVVARAVWQSIRAIVAAVIERMNAYVRTILDVVRWVMDRARDIWAAVWGKLAGPVESAVGAATRIIDRMGDAIEGVVGWVSNLIDAIKRIKFPSPPGWMSKVIPGMSAAAATGTASATGTRHVLSAGARGVPVLTGGTGGLTIVVQGALDPVGVARQIHRIITTDDRRRGVVVAGRPAAASGAL